MNIKAKYHKGKISLEPALLSLPDEEIDITVTLPDHQVNKNRTTVPEEIRFIDLKAQQQRILPRLLERMQAVLDHGQYILGPEVEELEKRLASCVGVEHAITCSSGTDALLMPLMAYGIGPGDAVFTTPFTFVATAEVIALLGATPVFVDIDPHTFNIDPPQIEFAIEAVQKRDPSIYPLPRQAIEGQLTPRGIIPVDLFGLPADYDRISEIAQKFGLFVLEDAAQSFGAEYKGRKACGLGDVGATSFFPAKPLGCYGDGGAVFTDDDNLAEKLLSIRVHGQGRDKYENVRLGLNGRLDSLQAAVLLAKMDIFQSEKTSRQKIARQYTDLLNRSAPLLKTPFIPEQYKSVWAQYSVLSESKRQHILKALKKERIPSMIYYPIPLHLQGAYRHLSYQLGILPISEKIARQIFSLPMHPYLTEEQIAHIISAISGA